MYYRSGFLDIGIERIVDQVVNPKIMTVFVLQVEDIVYKFLGLEKPNIGQDITNGLCEILSNFNLYDSFLK